MAIINFSSDEFRLLMFIDLSNDLIKEIKQNIFRSREKIIEMIHTIWKKNKNLLLSAFLNIKKFSKRN